jgi:hypothetical protein
MPTPDTIGPARYTQTHELSLHIPSLHCVEGEVNRYEANNHDPEHDQVEQHRTLLPAGPRGRGIRDRRSTC